MPLGNDRLEPDISVICDKDKLDERGCHGAPEWIIEVTSPSTRSRDYVYKLNIYQKYGCREYWVINPESRTVSVFCFLGMKDANVYHFSDKISVGLYPDLSLCIDEILLRA